MYPRSLTPSSITRTTPQCGRNRPFTRRSYHTDESPWSRFLRRGLPPFPQSLNIPSVGVHVNYLRSPAPGLCRCIEQSISQPGPHASDVKLKGISCLWKETGAVHSFISSLIFVALDLEYSRRRPPPSHALQLVGATTKWG